MPRRVVLPESRIRSRRRRARVRLSIFFGVLFILLIAALVGLSWVPALRIERIAISGNETVSTTTIEELVTKKLEGRILFVLPKDNILLYPRKEISEELSRAYPVFKEVVVRARAFNEIGVELLERHSKALWCGTARDETEGCRLMDETGFVYTPILLLDLPSYIRFTGEATTTLGYTSEFTPRQYVTPTEFRALVALIEALEAHQKETKIISADVDEHDDVRVVFANQFVLVFALKDTTGDVYERFTLALAAEPFLNRTIADFEYLDLRFGDKLYYKLKAQ